MHFLVIGIHFAILFVYYVLCSSRQRDWERLMIRQGTRLFRILSTPSMMTTGRRLSCTSRRGWSATARPRKPTAWARRMWPPFMPSRWGGNLMTVCLPVQVVWSTDTYPKFWLTSCLGRNVEIIKWADRKESCFASSCHCLCTCSFMSCSRSPVTSVSLLSSSPLFCFFFFFFFLYLLFWDWVSQNYPAWP